MKLPKGFGGQGFGGTLGKMQAAMERAQNISAELEAEVIEVDKGPVKAKFNGKGEILSISLDKAIVDPNDVETLEDLIVSVVRDGHERSVELHNSKLEAIKADLPNIPGLNL